MLAEVEGLAAVPAADPVDAGLLRQVEALPEKQRQAVTLYYMDERPVDEVAEMMGMPVNTVKTHLHRARASPRGRARHEGGRMNDLDTRMRRLFAGVDTSPGFEARVLARVAALESDAGRRALAASPSAAASSNSGGCAASPG